MSGAALVGVALAFSAWLRLSGRREQARAVAGFVPDLVRLSWRLCRDRRVPWRHRLLLLGLAAYLAMPLDLVPGSPLEDALLAVVVLRVVLRRNRGLVHEHWPGPAGSLDILLRLVGQPRAGEREVRPGVR